MIERIIIMQNSNFTYDLEAMKKALNSPTKKVPKSAIESDESFDKWLNEPDDLTKDSKINTETRHITKAGANIFLDLGFDNENAEKYYQESQQQINATATTTPAAASTPPPV